jgi:hypothetical protein
MAIYENEIESCMNDIANCQTKIANYKQKSLERNIHKDSYCSNLKIMEDWLENVKNSNLQKELESERYYTELSNKVDDRRANNNERNELCALRQIMKKKSYVDRESRKGRNSQNIFHNAYDGRCDNRPSEFMIKFIDATHNIFQIQQKQIEELKKIITNQQSREL